jgi:hypothetical protein
MRPAKSLLERASRFLRLAHASTHWKERQELLSAGLTSFKEAHNLDPALAERTNLFENFERPGGQEPQRQGQEPQMRSAETGSDETRSDETRSDETRSGETRSDETRSEGLWQETDPIQEIDPIDEQR